MNNPELPSIMLDTKMDYSTHENQGEQRSMDCLVTLCSSSPIPPCKVCGGRANGYHYGVITCEGCRAFFRRTVRSHKKYVCGYGGNCVINVKTRVQCGGCRFKKCLSIGMLRENVMGITTYWEKRSTPAAEPPMIQRNTISPNKFLLQNICQEETELDIRFSQHFPKTNLRPLTKAQEMFDGVHIELQYIVEWAKRNKVFNELDTPSKINLLKMHSTELIILETARRSMDVQDSIEEYFVGANGYKVSRSWSSKMDFLRRIFSEVLAPCRDLKMTADEFFCLKALIMYNPYTDGLQDIEKAKLGVFQEHVRSILEEISEGGGRLFKILMIMSSVCSVGEMMRGFMRQTGDEKPTKRYKLLDDLLLS